MASGEINRWVGINASFSDTQNWSLNSVPVDGEHVIFPAAVATSCTQNVDRTTDNSNAGLHLGSLTTQEGYEGNVGSSGNPLKVTASGLILHEGSGTLYLTCQRGSAGANKTHRVVINSANTALACELASNTLSEIDYIQIAAGRVMVDTPYGSTAWTDYLDIGGVPGAGIPDVTVAAGSGIRQISVSAGVVELNLTRCEDLDVSGGVVNLEASDIRHQGWGIGESATDVFRARVSGTGRLNWNGGVDSGTTAASLWAMAGETSFNETTLEKEMNVAVVHPGARVYRNRQWVSFGQYLAFASDEDKE